MGIIENKKAKIKNWVVYPVILSVPASAKELTRRERVKYLSRHARRALKISAEKSGIQLGELLKEDNGSPLPFDGNFWSVTHKPEYVGGVIASELIGIDIEKIRPCSKALFKKTADDREWALSDSYPSGCCDIANFHLLGILPIWYNLRERPIRFPS